MPTTRWGLATCTLTAVMTMIRTSRVGSRSARIVTANSRDALRYFCRGLSGSACGQTGLSPGGAVRRKKSSVVPTSASGQVQTDFGAQIKLAGLVSCSLTS